METKNCSEEIKNYVECYRESNVADFHMHVCDSGIDFDGYASSVEKLKELMEAILNMIPEVK